jgi:hypothetical protein
MVTVTGVETRKNSKDESFCLLILQGGLEIVTSKATGKQYATIHKVYIPATFDENVAKGMIGKELKGEIQRQETEPYEYTLKSTGEQVVLNYNYTYNPNPTNLAEVVIGANPAM